MVTVLMNNGKLKKMDKRFARALVYCKKAVYVEDYEKKAIENKKENSKELTIDELRILAKDRGIKFHHKAGTAKLKELLGIS